MIMHRAAGGLPRWDPVPGRARPHRPPAVDVASARLPAEAHSSARLLREMRLGRELSLDTAS